MYEPHLEGAWGGGPPLVACSDTHAYIAHGARAAASMCWVASSSATSSSSKNSCRPYPGAGAKAKQCKETLQGTTMPLGPRHPRQHLPDSRLPSEPEQVQHEPSKGRGITARPIPWPCCWMHPPPVTSACPNMSATNRSLTSPSAGGCEHAPAEWTSIYMNTCAPTSFPGPSSGRWSVMLPGESSTWTQLCTSKDISCRRPRHGVHPWSPAAEQFHMTPPICAAKMLWESCSRISRPRFRDTL